jgi:hypothetical protein
MHCPWSDPEMKAAAQAILGGPENVAPRNTQRPNDRQRRRIPHQPEPFAAVRPNAFTLQATNSWRQKVGDG